MPIQPVPDDICERVCSFIHLRGPKPLFTRTQAHAALTSFSLTTRSWCFASRTIRFERVHVQTAAQLAKLLDILKSHNYLAVHIRGLAIGKVLDGHIDLSTWTTRFFDFRVFETLLPHLQALRIGKIDYSQSPQTQVFRDFDNAMLPQSSQLVVLTLRARFFRDTAEASVFFSALPNIRQLCLQDVWPSFVRMLPTYIPLSVKYLRLHEYALWETDVGDIHAPIPPSPPMPNISLDYFDYRDLTPHAARELETTLLGFAVGATVRLELVRLRFPCREFDMERFKRRMKGTAGYVYFLCQLA